jgi:hypothetical protein
MTRFLGANFLASILPRKGDVGSGCGSYTSFLTSRTIGYRVHGSSTATRIYMPRTMPPFIPCCSIFLYSSQRAADRVATTSKKAKRLVATRGGVLGGDPSPLSVRNRPLPLLSPRFEHLTSWSRQGRKGDCYMQRDAALWAAKLQFSGPNQLFLNRLGRRPSHLVSRNAKQQPRSMQARLLDDQLAPLLSHCKLSSKMLDWL